MRYYLYTFFFFPTEVLNEFKKSSCNENIIRIYIFIHDLVPTSYLMKLLARAFSQIFKCIFEVYFKNFCPSLFERFDIYSILTSENPILFVYIAHRKTIDIPRHTPECSKPNQLDTYSLGS